MHVETAVVAYWNRHQQAGEFRINVAAANQSVYAVAEQAYLYRKVAVSCPVHGRPVEGDLTGGRIGVKALVLSILAPSAATTWLGPQG
jgi:hypothetical protein